MTVQLTDRRVLAVSGTDALPFLQGLLTADIAALTPGTSTWAGLLSPQGKALFELFAHAAADGLYLDVATDRADALLKRLNMYKLRRAVTLAMADLAVFWSPDADGPADPRLPAFGARWLAAPASAGDVRAYHGARLDAGLPEAAEVGEDRTLWLECNAAELNAVSFTKGCYVGQENTARMHHRDRVRRRLLAVRLTADPGAETAIMAGDRSAGELRGHAGGRGMAYLRIEFAAAELTLGGSALEVVWPDWLPR